jgi:hypothetical protein
MQGTLSITTSSSSSSRVKLQQQKLQAQQQQQPLGMARGYILQWQLPHCVRCCCHGSNQVCQLHSQPATLLLLPLLLLLPAAAAVG